MSTGQDKRDTSQAPDAPDAARRRELAVLLVLCVVLLAGCLTKWLMRRRLGREIDVVRAAVGAKFRLDLNRATADELQLLPGIGPDKASRIVAWREAHGGFRSADDLTSLRGISARQVDQIRGSVMCSRPESRTPPGRGDD